jgi:hypothetical protein
MYHLKIRELLVLQEAMLDYVLVNMHTEKLWPEVPKWILSKE